MADSASGSGDKSVQVKLVLLGETASGLIILFQTVFIIYDNAVWMCSNFFLRDLNSHKLT